MITSVGENSTPIEQGQPQPSALPVADEVVKGVDALKAQLAKRGLDLSCALKHRSVSVKPEVAEKPKPKIGGAQCVIVKDSLKVDHKTRFMTALEDVVRSGSMSNRAKRVQKASMILSLTKVKASLTGSEDEVDTKLRRICKSFAKQAKATWEGITEKEHLLAQRAIQQIYNEVE